LNALLPWQAVQWEQLVSRLEQRTLPHALLLHGPAGVGKRQFAAHYCQLLLCADPVASGPCGQCGGCRQFLAGSHPDCLVVAPLQEGGATGFEQFPPLPSQQGKKAPKTPVIAVTQVRELNEAVMQTSHQGGWRIVVITMAEAMNQAAANALLKLLEEPPPQLLFLLVSDRSGQLLPTIRSRCQMMHLGVPEPTQAAGWIADELGRDIDSSDFAVALALAHGAPLKARLLVAEGCERQLTDLVKTLSELHQGTLSPLAAAALWQKSDPGGVLDYWRFWVAELVRYRLGAASLLGSEGPFGGQIERQARSREASWLFGWLDRLNRDRSLLSGSINTRLLLDELAIGWSSLA